VTHQLASTGWTEARIERLKQLWADGLSASQIAGLMGGVTRNAVIGKVHRLGLSGRATVSRLHPARRYVRVSPIPVRTPAPPARTTGEARPQAPMPLAPAGAGPSPSGRIDLASLADGACRWPLGDPKQPDFHFCGSHANGAVYCEHHARIAYQETARRRAVTPLVCWRKSHA
jgi:GcrA cell cycle regulator